MTDAPFPAHMLAWKASSDVIRMEEIPVAPKLMFDNPYEDDGDRLNKVNKYWKVCNKERMQREARYKVLLDAEVEATMQRKAREEEAARVKAREEEAAQEREKEQKLEKEKDTEPVKVKEAGPSGNAKGKAREVPRTPRKVTPKNPNLRSNLSPKKMMKTSRSPAYTTAWAVMDGSKQVVDAVWELAGLGRHQEAGQLEVIWHDHQRFMMEVEKRATADLSAVDTRMLQLLELKSTGIEIPEDLETRIRTERDVIQCTLNEQLEDLTVRMDSIQKHTAWTKNGLPRLTPEVPPAATQGTKRKGDNEGDRAEGSKKKKKKKVVETEDEESTMR
ncbi:hypothetical protein M422DRAFT_253334, partial [Sphaerobolus stellatus SS14]